MTTLHLRVCSVVLLCLVAGALLLSQTPVPQGNGEQWAIAQVRIYQATR